ncbi:radical SAM protein [Helicobacter sp. 13S00401-1]|uniref:radical SAM protein n=1 Tax=Helicobacter sp. 13S00401-1 TaxID=1905758 RepID=UPI000BA63B3E|nr:radical SAM protein [Helicobacter sp. 13S00401-1]PAF50361.1 radical SAM protein [Helicobacter sp. 13S00401-1]
MFSKRVKGHHRESIGLKESASLNDLEGLLKKAPSTKEGIIYVHVPFCDNICSFCNLNRTKLESKLDGYTKFLLDEIEHYSSFPYIQGKVFKSIYFGGGTPSILKEDQLDLILDSINKHFKLAKDVEFSMETTLHNLNKSKIEIMKSHGVNRYSIGVQTFSNKGRKLLNRVGSGLNAIKKLELIRESFKGMICIDIIYNYPEESMDEVLNDAKVIKDLKLDSASFYSLQFQEGSLFSQKYDSSYYSLEIDHKLHNAFLESMLSDGTYEVLEYTKVARKKRDRYLYIRLSHKGVDILPLGVGAAGRLGEFSIVNPKMRLKVVSKISPVESNFARYSNLFQYDKISLSDIKSYLNEASFKEVDAFFKLCEKEGLVCLKDNLITYNLDGIFWGNTIATKAIELSKASFIKDQVC